jgi:hypothetical protein
LLMSWLLLLLEFLLPQDEIDEADETEESEEDEEDDSLAVVTATEGLKSIFVPIIDVDVVTVVVDPNPAFIFVVGVDRFDIATPSRKSNNSPKSVMGDHLFHSIFFPLPPTMDSAEVVFWDSAEAIVLDDVDRSN